MSADVGSKENPKLRAKRLTLLQWNYDYMATKIVELRELVSRAAVDVIIPPQKKLGVEDSTPSLPGFEAIRRDRPGSEVTIQRSGGLLIHVKQGTHFTEYPIRKDGPLEAQSIGIPTSKRRELRVTNLYLPPDRTLPASSADNLSHWLTEFQRRDPELICGDLYAHHPTWDQFVREDRRGSTIQQWMEDPSRLTLNDGTTTRYARFQQGGGCSAPDLTIVGAAYIM